MEILMGLFVVGVGIIGLLVFGWNYLQKRRRKEMRNFASAVGYEFKDNDDALLSELVSKLQFFNRGEGKVKKIQNIIEGMINGNHIKIFDYQWTLRKFDTQPHAWETVILFEQEHGIEAANRELFELTKKNAIDHLGQEVPTFLLGNKCWLIERKSEKVVFCRTHGIADQRIKPSQIQEYISQSEKILFLL